MNIEKMQSMAKKEWRVLCFYFFILMVVGGINLLIDNQNVLAGVMFIFGVLGFVIYLSYHNFDEL